MSHDAHDHPDIGCLEAIEGLYALLDGELTDPENAEQIEAHIAHCRSCYSRAEIEKAITGRIRELRRDAGSGEAPPGRLQRRLRKILDEL